MCCAAKKLKVKTIVLSDDKDGPAQHFCDQFIYSKYDDNTKVKEYITKDDVLTYEFEYIPIDFIKLVFPTALVPYNNIPFCVIPRSKSFVTYNS